MEHRSIGHAEEWFRSWHRLHAPEASAWSRMYRSCYRLPANQHRLSLCRDQLCRIRSPSELAPPGWNWLASAGAGLANSQPWSQATIWLRRVTTPAAWTIPVESEESIVVVIKLRYPLATAFSCAGPSSQTSFKSSDSIQLKANIRSTLSIQLACVYRLQLFRLMYCASRTSLCGQ